MLVLVVIKYIFILVDGRSARIGRGAEGKVEDESEIDGNGKNPARYCLILIKYRHHRPCFKWNREEKERRSWHTLPNKKNTFV